MVIETQVADHERRLGVVEGYVDKLQDGLAKIQGSQDTMLLLIKWVILPLIALVGGLVGIKLVLPS